MNLLKIFVNTVLITGVTLGVTIDSVKAQFITRPGNGYSSRGGNEEDVFNTFILYDIGRDGQPILDNDGDLNNDEGLFIGAVEEFNSYVNFSTDSPREPIEFDRLMPDATAPIANLETRWYENEEINSELGLSGSYNGNIIEYTISGQGNSLNEPIDLSLYLLDTSFAPSLPIDFTPEKATNDLSYIFDNKLLDFAIPFEPFSGADFSGLRFIDEQLVNDEDIFEDQFFAGGSFEQEIEDNISVPESNYVTSLLVLGLIGVSIGLKQKIKY